jgi:hypothetical protein
MIRPMTEPLAYPSLPVLPFVNRSGFLIAAGILMLLAGVMTGCGAMMMPVALAVPEQPGVQKVTLQQVLVALFTYAALATALIWLGVGLIKRRRWSRPLTLILATHWLILGVLTIVASIALYPVTRDMMATLPNMPTEMVAVMLIIGIGMSSLFMIALPVVILWLVKSNDVLLTVEHFDPVPRWTDHCPLKILGLSITLHLAGVIFFFGTGHATLPIAGVLLRGLPAVAVILVIAALLVVAGYWVYKLQMRGWWLGLLTIIVPTLAMIPSALRIPPSDLYRAFGTPEENLVATAQHEGLIRLCFVGFLLLFAVSFAIYMLRMRPLMIAARDPMVQRTSDPI